MDVGKECAELDSSLVLWVTLAEPCPSSDLDCLGSVACMPGVMVGAQ